MIRFATCRKRGFGWESDPSGIPARTPSIGSASNGRPFTATTPPMVPPSRILSATRLFASFPALVGAGSQCSGPVSPISIWMAVRRRPSSNPMWIGPSIGSTTASAPGGVVLCRDDERSGQGPDRDCLSPHRRRRRHMRSIRLHRLQWYGLEPRWPHHVPHGFQEQGRPRV